MGLSDNVNNGALVKKGSRIVIIVAIINSPSWENYGARATTLHNPAAQKLRGLAKSSHDFAFI